METIQGLTNWRLSVRREEGSVVILRALTCDKKAALPDTLFGLPVTALSDRALAHGAAGAAGEDVLILGGAESADWDNRNIRDLTLPRGLQSIGDYALMNLRAMETLRLCDDLVSTGSATFMNCRSFSKIELTRTGPKQGPALASIVRNLQQELDVTIRRTDGSSLRLIFPEYIENYTENTPAHHFELKISGGGYAYHSVFRDKRLRLQEYDALWPGYVAAEHDEGSALRLAYWRLRCPVRERTAALYGISAPESGRGARLCAGGTGHAGAAPAAVFRGAGAGDPGRRSGGGPCPAPDRGHGPAAGNTPCPPRCGQGEEV